MDMLLVGIVGIVLVVGIGGALADVIAALRPVPEDVAPRPVPGRTLHGFDALQREVYLLSARLRTIEASRSSVSGTTSGA